jgi:cell division initiation protein
MPLTPVEIRHIDLRRAWFRGYRRPGVDALLTEIADSFEEVWRERADLQDANERLESDIARHRDLESLLRKTLMTAERSAEELREQARREADVVLAEARAEARKITQGALADRDHLRAEASRIRALLRAALDLTDEQNGDDEAVEAA